ncbi:gliding motility-associated peptidyl-prolyl isomerase GldI [Gilvibacter sediminis]|uniref:gliding motility-associated peptidyl-prolyl isomerase GldI n=1 Tax=Gilvibacter sediminis TaxID=379071 RepID=UPI002350EB17|nr:gliding motility-associated peptidyl-prolyl isomerase GldI [Gilvibacter sediminis]MDC7998904.1 gliding motility-associated peptidyl-prolyl isomerase GldI [Gilvibacter sediminis]
MPKPLLFLITLFMVVSCAQPEARKPVSQSSGSFVNASVSRNQKLVAQQEAAIKEVIAKDTTTTYTASENGFWFSKTVTDSSTTYLPQFGDRLVFDYQVEDIYGNVIYPKAQISPRSYVMDQQELITGLRQALKMMHAGESMTLFLPSYTAYGYYGDDNKIGINYPLKVKVDLKSIEPQSKNESNN